MEKKSRSEKAMENFLAGYNCSQSLVLAFSDLLEMDEELLLKMASSFGGGMGRLREVCGSVSGMFMVMGCLKGYSGPERGPVKAEHYKRIQELAHRFEAENGSIVCRQLLGLSVKEEAPIPAERTKEYYEKRPCRELIGCAARILEEYLDEPDKA